MRAMRLLLFFITHLYCSYITILQVNAFQSPSSSIVLLSTRWKTVPTSNRHNNLPLYASKQPSSSSAITATRNRQQQQDIDDGISFSFTFDIQRYQVLIKCLFAILIYMIVGTICFSCIFEKWPIVDSLYFSVVTFTTVGYGDLVPSTDAGRLCAILFSFGGISIVGALLGYVGATIIEAERKVFGKIRTSVDRAKLMSLFDPLKKKRNAGWKIERRERLLLALQNRKSVGWLKRLIYSRLFAIRIRGDGSRSLIRHLFDTAAGTLYIFVPFVSLAFYIGKREGWTPITSLYYAMATASTVGYGDFAPTSQKMRLLSLAFIPLAVISLGEILGRIAGYFIRKETNKAEREFMDRKMTLEDLEEMDTNDDGEVDLFEFMSFMLSKMGKVDIDMMNDLKYLFESLDETLSNTIQKEDLLLLAQIRDWRRGEKKK